MTTAPVSEPAKPSDQPAAKPWVRCAVVLGPALAVLLVITWVSVANGVPLSMIVEDPAALARLHPLIGIQSSLGVLLWCAAATLCFFTAAVLWGAAAPRLILFLLASGLLSSYLLLDDLFQFHEKLASQYLGVRQKHVLAGLAVAVAAYLVGFRRVIVATPYALLGLAMLLLSASAVIDAVVLKLWPQQGVVGLFLEEGSKWLGIAAWCGYFAVVCAQSIRHWAGGRPGFIR
jgi:hypothetical protein